MALQMGKPIPFMARDAYFIVEMNCRPTLTELDNMPSELVDQVLLYGLVKNTIEQGGTLTL